MRVAFLTDVHVCEDRIEEHDRLVKALVDDIGNADPDLVLVGGDLAGTRVPHRSTPAERNLLASMVFHMAEGFDVPVVVIRGNHDYPGDYSFFEYLPGVFWSDEPELIKDPKGAWGVVTLPWIDRSNTDRELPYPEAVQAVYDDALAEMEEGLAAVTGPIMALGHLAIAEALVRAGQPLTPTADPVLSPSWLDGLTKHGISAVAMGHYHHPQEIELGGWPLAFYGGSVFASEHGEDHRERGWTLLTFREEAGKWRAGREHRPLKQSPWLKIRIDVRADKIERVEPGAIWAGETAAGIVTASGDAAGWRIKLVADVDEDDADVADERVAAFRAAFLEVGALAVRVEINVRRSSRVRDGAGEIAAAATLPAKVELYFDAIERPPKREVQRRAHAILKEIDADLDRSSP